MEERDFAKFAFLIVAVVAVTGLIVSGGWVGDGSDSSITGNSFKEPAKKLARSVKQAAAGKLGTRCTDNVVQKCTSGLCGMNEQGKRVCETPNQFLGASCFSGLECASGVCGLNEEYKLVCEELNQPGARCKFGIECASNICGLNEQHKYVCEEPNQPSGAPCNSYYECASETCSQNVCG